MTAEEYNTRLDSVLVESMRRHSLPQFVQESIAHWILTREDLYFVGKRPDYADADVDALQRSFRNNELPPALYFVLNYKFNYTQEACERLKRAEKYLRENPAP